MRAFNIRFHFNTVYFGYETNKFILSFAAPDYVAVAAVVGRYVKYIYRKTKLGTALSAKVLKFQLKVHY